MRRHGVPVELLSGRGQNLLSGLIKQFCAGLWMTNLNTTAYYPHTDGLEKHEQDLEIHDSQVCEYF